MKKLYCSLLTSVLLAVSIESIAQSDFTVVSPSTDPYSGLIKPLKAGSSIQIQVKMTNNKNVTYTASIDKNAMFPQDSWVQIDNNSQTLAYNQTVTFLLTITVPVGTSDINNYPLPLRFNAYDSNHNNNPYTGQILKVLVDNTPPVPPTVSVSSRTSSAISIGFSSSDLRSTEYTNANQSSGINGIKSYTLILKNPDGTVKESKSGNATDMSSYTFSSLTPYTSYTTTVLAADLAGNTNMSSAVPVKTLIAAPTNLAVSATYCSITLTWSASAGATGYKVYTASGTLITPNPISATSFTITGLSAGSTSSYYVTAVNGAEVSAPSSTLSTSTLTVPKPTVAGPTITCSLYSNLTFSVTNPPSGCSVSWGCNSNLSLSSVAGNSATFTTIANGPGKVTAVYSSCGGSGSLQTASVWIGFPLMPVIDGEHTIPCGGGELYTENSRMQVQWSISSPFRIVGGSSGSKCNIQAPPESAIAWLYATATNACGTNRSEFEISVNCDYYTVFPNPASSEVTIAQLSKKAIASEDKKDKLIKSVRVADRFGNTLYFQKYGSETVESKLNISNFPIGVYVITINEGSNAESHTIVKQ